MTPLIQRAIRGMWEYRDDHPKPAPEGYVWFDVQAAHVEAERLRPHIPPESFTMPPFPNTAFVFEYPNGDPIIVSTRPSIRIDNDENTSDRLFTVSFLSPSDGWCTVSQVLFGNNGEPNEWGRNVFHCPPGTYLSEEQQKTALNIVMTAFYAYHYASTKTIKGYRVTQSQTNSKRIAKGKKPLFDWHSITVEPKPLPAPVAEPSEPTGIKHRQHDVRGHWCVRHSTGKRYWRNAHKRGDASLGVIFKSYEVGKRIDTIPTVT